LKIKNDQEENMVDWKISKGFLIIIVGLLVVIFALTTIQGVSAQDQSIENRQGQVFSTWEGFEPDKCASIWLIQRFIDSHAIISFFPKGEPINGGIPFDTPDAKFRRYARMSTFESLVQHYNLTCPKLAYIGKIIHDIEINIWERKVMPETISVRDSINKIILETKDNKQIIEKGNKFFDTLYRKLKVDDSKGTGSV